MTLTIRILAWLALTAAAVQLAGGFAPVGGAPGEITSETQRHGEGETRDSQLRGGAGEQPANRQVGNVDPPVGDAEGAASDASRRLLWADGFERAGRTAHQPAGWHYLRGGRLEEDASAPEGRRCVVFRVTSPGRDAEVRRLFPLEGIDAAGLSVSVAVRLGDVRPGQFSEQRPALLIDFVDDRGEGLSHQRLGPWHGTSEWGHHELTVPIPARATGMLLRLGLFGATGEAAFDGLEIRAADVNPSIFPR